MKKQTVLILLLAVPLIVGCSKKFLPFTLGFPLYEAFEVDQTGQFGGQFSFSSSEVRDAFDIPSDAWVDSVYVESVSVTILTREGNAASAVVVSGRVESFLTGWIDVFSNFSITLPPVGQETTFPITDLNDAGISSLRSILQGIVLLGSYTGVNLEFTGNSSPGGQRIVADITITIQGSIVGGSCVDMPLTELDDCPE